MEQTLEKNLSQAETGALDAPGENKKPLSDEESQRPEKATRSHSFSRRFWGIVALSAIAAGVAMAIILSVTLTVCYDEEEDAVSTTRYVPVFEEDLPLLSDKVLEGYSNSSEFELDLRKFSESFVNGVVGRNYGDKSYGNFGMGGVLVVPDIAEGSTRGGVTSASPESDGSQEGVGGEGVNDYETNDQETGVHEGDKVLTDGNIAIAAYGKYIVGWNVTDGSKIFKMEMKPTDKYGGQPYINTMLLNEKRLFVVATGYGYGAQTSEQRVLSDYLGTRVLVYDMDSIGRSDDKLDLLAQRDVNGYFVSVRGIGNTVHLVLRSQINMYPFFVEPYDRYSNEFMSTMDLETYAAEVRTLSSQKNIPEFVNRTISEIMECGALPQLVRLNRWTTHIQSDSAMEHYLYHEGYVRSMVMVASFDLDAIAVNGTEAFTCVPMTGAFFPADAWDVQVYVATGTMIMAVRGFDYNAEREMSIDTTYIVAFGLAGASARPKALGSWMGSVLNQYSFRVDGAILEFATTVREQFRWTMRGERLLDRHLQEMEEPAIVSVPTTENYVITASLEVSDEQIKELDRIKLGKEGEVFTAVRFYKNRAYAVTFRQMDPFYVLNMEDPNNITIAGILDNITGWSSYLEPMNDDNTVMLAIGQEANEFGGPVGVSISVFDARDLSNVTLSARLLIESNNNVWSDSEGLREKNAIRFNPESGILILPLRLDGDKYFRGFRVYIAKVDSVSATCAVDLSEDYDYTYWSDQSIDPRAMIINGSMMTTMESDVTMTYLTNCTQDWNLKWS